MKFNTKNALLGSVGFLIIYLIAGVGVIFVGGEGIEPLLLDFIYIKLGAFLGVVSFILLGILSGLGVSTDKTILKKHILSLKSKSEDLRTKK